MRRIPPFVLGILAPALTGVAFAAVWIAATGTFRPPWWALAIASAALAALSYTVETAGTARRTPQPPRARRRAHARTTPTTPTTKTPTGGAA